jgi:hypothetical protein
MESPVVLENIEAMRLQEGIVDHVLRKGIKGLGVGDFVKLTFLFSADATTGETLSVRITEIKRGAFRGELSERPVSVALSKIDVGESVPFTSAHIHSLTKARPRD